MSELCEPKTRRKSSGVLWIDPTEPESSITFALLFGPPDVDEDDVPTAMDRRTLRLFGGLFEDCRASVWLIAYSESPVPEGPARLLRDTRNALGAPQRQELAKRMPDPQGFAFGTVHDDGGRFYLEVRPGRSEPHPGSGRMDQ